ncbi:MORN repeat-containing protein 1 [Arapaima gigas]
MTPVKPLTVAEVRKPAHPVSLEDWSHPVLIEAHLGKTAGEYVLVVTDRTSPPFLGWILPPCFALLRVIPKKVGGSVSLMAGHISENK